MTNELLPLDTLQEGYLALPNAMPSPQVVPCRIGGRLYGVPVEKATDMVILSTASMTPIAFAPPSVRGAVVHQTRMACVIDSRLKLGLPAAEGNSLVGLTVEHDGHFYVLTVDEVGELAAIHNSREPIIPLDIGMIVGP